MLSHSVFLADEATTINMGRMLARATSTIADVDLIREDGASLMTQGGVIYLRGDLGSGKTTLTRGIMRGYGYKGAVKSPTYTLVEPYENLAGNIYHFDLYRLAHVEEVQYLGVEDYFVPSSLCIVEWPERGVPAIPAADVILELSDMDVAKESGRNLAITSVSDRGETLYYRLLKLLKN